MIAFRDVYAAHAAAVTRHLVRVGVPTADLEDVLQEVFVVVHRKLPTYDTARPLRPWLCGIASWVALAYHRLAVRREVPTADAGAAVIASDPRARPDEALLAHERVMTGLRPLSHEQRVVLLLCDLEGLAAPEVAQVLEVPVGTVYSRLHEARARFAHAAADPPQPTAANSPSGTEEAR